MAIQPLSWQELESLTDYSLDYINGKTNAQSRLRLFNQPESTVRVTLYRDHHAWCPYCQKVWLWLEEKEIPYRIEKVTMFCYGQKESWYTQRVPSGMLPAVEIDGQLITESDEILIALENTFGSLGLGMQHPQVIPLRRLERLLFRAWCSWLCTPSILPGQDQHNRRQFVEVVAEVEKALAVTDSPFFLDDFSTADLVFIVTSTIKSAKKTIYAGQRGWFRQFFIIKVVTELSGSASAASQRSTPLIKPLYDKSFLVTTPEHLRSISRKGLICIIKRYILNLIPP